MTVARFNRRMPKTACPVVWEGLGAQSSMTRPDQSAPEFLAELMDVQPQLHKGHKGERALEEQKISLRPLRPSVQSFFGVSYFSRRVPTSFDVF